MYLQWPLVTNGAETTDRLVLKILKPIWSSGNLRSGPPRIMPLPKAIRARASHPTRSSLRPLTCGPLQRIGRGWRWGRPRWANEQCPACHDQP